MQLLVHLAELSQGMATSMYMTLLLLYMIGACDGLVYKV